MSMAPWRRRVAARSIEHRTGAQAQGEREREKEKLIAIVIATRGFLSLTSFFIVIATRHLHLLPNNDIINYHRMYTIYTTKCINLIIRVPAPV